MGSTTALISTNSTNLAKQSRALPKSVLAPISHTFTAWSWPTDDACSASPAPHTPTCFCWYRVFRAATPTCFHSLGWGGEQSPRSHSDHPQCSPLLRACFACAILTPLPQHMAQARWEDNLGKTHPFLLGSRYKDAQTIVCSYHKGKAGGKGSREGRKQH